MNKNRFLSRALSTTMLASVVAGALAVSAPDAHAAVPTALERCQSGAAPDIVESVFHAGTKTQVTFPSATPDPDNGIYPGDVVKVTVTGKLRYDTVNIAGPNGVGAPDVNGIRPYSSTATFNNNPGGWVGNEMPTSALAGCTNAPGIAARLIYRLRDPNLADNAGGFTVTTSVWRAPGRISIDATELTQGIQTPRAEVALIGGKRTFLRVYLRHRDDGLGAMSGVSASLTVDGVTGTVYPLVSNSITTSTAGSDPRVLPGGFIFELPAGAIGTGVRQAILTVRPPNGRGGGQAIVKHIPLSFGPTTSLQIFGLRYGYTNVPTAMVDALKATQPGLNNGFAGYWLARQVADWEPMRVTAENALPLAALSVTDQSPNSIWGASSFDCKGAQDTNGAWSCGGYVDARAWAEAYVDQKCPNGGCWVIVLQPEVDDGHHGAHYVSDKGNHVINIQGERSADQRGLTMAHEIGHGLGLAHTWEDTSYPRSDGGLGPFVAVRYSPSLSLVSGQNATGQTTAYDLMSYDTPAWFSPHNYCSAMAGLTGSHPLCALGMIG
jgi:hypothetical protein